MQSTNISLSCFDDKIFILNNRYDRNVNYTKTVIILDFGIMRTAFEIFFVLVYIKCLIVNIVQTTIFKTNY